MIFRVSFCLFLFIRISIQQGDTRIAAFDSEDVLPHHDKCQPITVPFCKDTPYNETIMPNLLGHATQEEAGSAVHPLFLLVKINCSVHFQFFMCSVYVPVCTILDHPLPPCRPLCLAVKGGCEGIMKKFGYEWPHYLACEQYPMHSTSENLCVPGNVTTIPPDYNQNDNFEETGVIKHKTSYTGKGKGRDIGFVCPEQFKVPEILEYSFKVGNKVEKNCGAPCKMMFFSENKRQFARVWIGIWAMLCSVSCLFTVCTFLIDNDRFRYPERPIIFLSLCYLMVAIAYVVGFLAGDSIACREPFPSKHGTISVSTITQGTKYELCTILFMVLYFFTMSSSIWWVVLTLTWFLAAGLKWGHEAIEANSQYFHLAAWAIPAIKTIAILAMGKVDGDVLSGVCYVGIWNKDALRVFILIPFCIYLAFGFIFITVGFVSLFRIRTVMKHDGTKTDKLEKLMIRIGIFSVLYAVPAVTIIACLFYEHFYFEEWMLTWTRDMCKKHTKYAVPCPRREKSNYIYPQFEVFMIKYLMYMIVGITSSVWIWSGKTMHTWKVFFHRLQGRHAEAYV